ncbi:MAG: hydroxymethylbilane synthase [Acidobacteriota bacterium]
MSASSAALRLGTRRSQLAMTQSQQVADALAAHHADLTVDLVPIVSQGDQLSGSLAKHGGKGLFTEALETRLLDDAIDLAVHSLKDLPVQMRAPLTVAAYPARADARDALISDVADHLDDLPAGAELLTGSLRRTSQILARRPDLRVTPIRGNVDTRLRRWRASGAAGVILAQAGLVRLGLDRRDFDGRPLPIHPIPPDVLLPAPGQGTLALQCVRDRSAAARCAALDDPATRRAAEAERHIVAAFGADCTLPLAAWARPDDDDPDALRLDAAIALTDGSRIARGTGVGATPAQAADACLAAMRRDGADAVRAALGGNAS